MDIQRFQHKFERTLAMFLAEKRRTLRLTNDPFLLEMLRYPEKLLAGGKRVRPYIASLMFRASGGRDSAVSMRVFLSLELFHCFGLMHDDIIDHGTSRHGVKTLHLHATDRLKAEHRLGDLAHIGEAQAILMGDMLHAWSVELLTDAAREPFFRMTEEVLFGQMLDVYLTTQKTTTEKLVMDKMRLKTASYTFIRPLEIGAALAGKLSKHKDFCQKIGLSLGLAFQIQDDLLDLTTPSSKSKKTTLSDLSERQHTLFTQYIFNHGTKQQQTELTALMGKKLTEKDRPRVVKLFTGSGAIEYGRQIIQQQFVIAEVCVASASFSKPIKQEFYDVIGFIKARAS